MSPEPLTLSLHGVTLEIHASDVWLAQAVEPCFAWLDRATDTRPDTAGRLRDRRLRPGPPHPRSLALHVTTPSPLAERGKGPEPGEWAGGEVGCVQGDGGSETIQPGPVLRVILRSAAELPSLPADAEPQYRHFGTSCYASSSARWLVDDSVHAELHDDTASMTAWVLDSARDEPGGLQGVALTGVLELLREARLYQLHAGCVDRGGVGMLFCGGQGAGKTTATIAMARAGWGVVSDDLALLRRGGAAVEALEWRERMNVGRDTLVAFGLWNRIVGTRTDGRYVADMWGEPATRRVRRATPRHLLVLTRTGEQGSVLRPMKRPAALAQLVRQSPLVLVGRPDKSEEHLELLRDLADQCECYELCAGLDVLDGALPRLVGDL